MNSGFAVKAAAELSAELAHEVNVRTCETEDRLPVVADSEKPCIRVLSL